MRRGRRAPRTPPLPRGSRSFDPGRGRPPPPPLPPTGTARPPCGLRGGFRSLPGEGGREAARPGGGGLPAGVRGHQGPHLGSRKAHGPPRPAPPHAPHPQDVLPLAPFKCSTHRPGLGPSGSSRPLMGSGPAHLPYPPAGWMAPGRGSKGLAATPVHQPASPRLVGPQPPWEGLGAGNEKEEPRLPASQGLSRRGVSRNLPWRSCGLPPRWPCLPRSPGGGWGGRREQALPGFGKEGETLRTPGRGMPGHSENPHVRSSSHTPRLW